MAGGASQARERRGWVRELLLEGDGEAREPGGLSYTIWARATHKSFSVRWVQGLSMTPAK